MKRRHPPARAAHDRRQTLLEVLAATAEHCDAGLRGRLDPEEAAAAALLVLQPVVDEDQAKERLFQLLLDPEVLVRLFRDGGITAMSATGEPVTLGVLRPHLVGDPKLRLVAE